MAVDFVTISGRSTYITEFEVIHIGDRFPGVALAPDTAMAP
jgi:hypothetical protein